MLVSPKLNLIFNFYKGRFWVVHTDDPSVSDIRVDILELELEEEEE